MNIHFLAKFLLLSALLLWCKISQAQTATDSSVPNPAVADPLVVENNAVAPEVGQLKSLI